MLPGDVLAGRFEIERVAGSGGMGTVYRARDRATGEPVAVKVLHGRENLERFSREARVLEGVRHGAVVRYVARGELPGGSPFLVMEWLEGEDLAARLTRGRLTLTETVALARRVAEALHAVHAMGVVHRDLKPSNLFLQGGQARDVKLLDFGVALARGATGELTRAGTAIGTLGYMAPEQVRGDRDVGARADVFSLGCVLFQCLSGQPAFTGDHAVALLAKVLLEEAPALAGLRPDIPPRLAALVDRMLHKRPEGRPESAAAVLSELDDLGPTDDVDPAPAAPEAANAPPAQLTSGEQRLLAVILIAAPSRTMAVAAVPEASLASTLAADSLRFSGPTLFSVAAAHGAHLDHLADGTSVLTLGGDGAATDRAAVSARCALAARGAAPGASIVLAMGLGSPGQAAPVGEVIERAARLLRVVAPGAAAEIRIDDLTAGLLGDRFDVRADSKAWYLRGEQDASAGDARLFLGRATPCVGRDREIAAIEDEIDAGFSGPSARAVLVTGEAGVGKSRLRHELLRRLRGREGAPEVWMARGDPLSREAPFGLLGQVLHGVFGLSAGEPPQERRDKLAAHARRHLGEEGQRVAEFLGELCAAPFPDDGNVKLRAARHDPVLMGDQMLRAWVDLVDAESAAGPVLLILEDVHWGDLPSIQHVDAALRLLPERPFVVLALARPEVNSVHPNLWGKRRLVEIHLRELPRRAALELAREVLGERADPATLDRLWSQSAGNALFLEELLRAIAQGRGGDAPPTVLAMMQARLEGQGAEARRVLRAGSVFGQRFWKGGVDALLGGAPAAAALAALVDDELITRARDTRFAGQPEYTFRHALVGQAAYAALTAEDRRVGHRLAAEWLLSAGEPAAFVLAEHLEKGGEPGRAAAAYRRAAEQAFEGNDLALAVSLAERALRCAEAGTEVEPAWLGETHLLLARVILWRGQNREALRSGMEAIRLLPEGSIARCEAATEAAVAAARTHEIEALRACQAVLLSAPLPAAGDAGLASSQRDDSAARAAVALARVARLGFFLGDSATGERLLARARSAAALAGGDPSVHAQIDLAESIRELIKGDLGTHLRLGLSARAGFEAAGDLRNACQQDSNIGYAEIQLGLYEAAERDSRKAMLDAERLGITALELHARLNLGVAAAHAGRVAEGAALIEDAVASGRGKDDRRFESFGRIYLARLSLLAGSAERAAEEAGRVASDPTNLASLRAFALATLALAHLRTGRIQEAVSAAEEASRLLAEMGDVEEGEAVIRLALAESHFAARGAAGAVEAVREARDRLLRHAADIADPELRRSYLSNVPENARTLELAREVLGEEGAG